jgi:hypothetical protein
MCLIKTLTGYGLAALCLMCLAVCGQAWAVETIQENWELSQEVSVLPKGGIDVKQAVVGWGLVENGVTNTVSLWDSFKGFKGTASVSQAAGNLNNVFSLVHVDQGGDSGGISNQMPVNISSVIANNAILNFSSTYNAVIGGGSFSSSRGFLAVTQVAGNMNNIFNIVGFSTKDAPALALSNASLSDISASNNVYKNYGVSQANVEIQADSFKGFSGVGSVIQAAGNFIQIHSQVSVRVNQ